MMVDTTAGSEGWWAQLKKDVQTGQTIGRRSVRFTLDRPVLLVFPILSGVLVLTFLLVSGLIVGVGIGLIEVAGVSGLNLFADPYWAIIIGVNWFFVAVLTTFFNAALVHETTCAFEGGSPSVRRGVVAAWQVRWKILVWGVLSASVHLVLRALEWIVTESDNIVVVILAGIVAILLGSSWVVMTFFIVPVIVFDETGVRGMFGESARLFHQLWGESIGASFGLIETVEIPAFLVGIVTILGVVYLSGILRVVSFVIGATVVVGLLVIRAAALGVVLAALYEYATTDEIPEVLADIDVQNRGIGSEEDIELFGNDIPGRDAN